ncbi:hypothetical protein Tco_0711455 [Tanacetum coccineum]
MKGQEESMSHKLHLTVACRLIVMESVMAIVTREVRDIPIVVACASACETLRPVVATSHLVFRVAWQSGSTLNQSEDGKAREVPVSQVHVHVQGSVVKKKTTAEEANVRGRSEQLRKKRNYHGTLV